MPRVDYLLCHKLIAFFFTNGLPSVPQRFAFYSATGILFVLQVDIFLLCRKESIYCKAAVLVRNWDTVVCCNLYIDGTKLTIEFDILHIVTNVLWAFRNVPPSAGKVSIRPGIKNFLKTFMLYLVLFCSLTGCDWSGRRLTYWLRTGTWSPMEKGQKSPPSCITSILLSSSLATIKYNGTWGMRTNKLKFQEYSLNEFA